MRKIVLNLCVCFTLECWNSFSTQASFFIGTEISENKGIFDGSGV